MHAELGIHLVVLARYMQVLSDNRSIFDEVDQDPDRLRVRDVLLRQEGHAKLADVEWWREHCGHLQRELDNAKSILLLVEQSNKGRVALRQDVRGADEDDARIVTRPTTKAHAGAVRP